jgi:hypothetical protein
MNVIYKPRGSGRTTDLIHRASLNEHGVIITATANSAIHTEDMIISMVKEKKISREPKVYSFWELQNHRLNGVHPAPVLYIDNLDYIIKYMFPNEIHTIVLERQ